MSEAPNPHGELVVCCQCGKRPTFTIEALCGVCRGAITIKKKPKGER